MPPEHTLPVAPVWFTCRGVVASTQNKIVLREGTQRRTKGFVYALGAGPLVPLVAQRFSLLQHELHAFNGLPLTAEPHERFTLQVK